MQLIIALRGGRLGWKNRGTKSFDRFFTDMHSNEQADVLFIMELHGDITTTTTIN
jgi:hypothetical protein